MRQPAGGGFIRAVQKRVGPDNAADAKRQATANEKTTANLHGGGSQSYLGLTGDKT